MPYNMNEENMCNDCGIKLVECDMCECCAACCDCDDEWLPDLPVGGYFEPCCPEWATDHVVPMTTEMIPTCWLCSHCDTEHYTTNDGKMWQDGVTE